MYMQTLTWQQVLDAPCFLLNLDRSPDRLQTATENIHAAGFSRVERIRGFDKDRDNLDAAWHVHGDPKKRDKDGFLTNKGKQACALGHYHIWKKMMNDNIPYAVVFEDDVFFHKNWESLAPEYWGYTPRDFDILYFGSSFDVRVTWPVLRAPVYCTHAYFITLTGAQKLYDTCIRDSMGTWTIDCQLREYMEGKRGTRPPFQWYLWNGLLHLDPNAMRSPKWQERLKNSGLVFQDEGYESFVNETPF